MHRTIQPCRNSKASIRESRVRPPKSWRMMLNAQNTSLCCEPQPYAGIENVGVGYHQIPDGAADRTWPARHSHGLATSSLPATYHALAMKLLPLAVAGLPSALAELLGRAVLCWTKRQVSEISWRH